MNEIASNNSIFCGEAGFRYLRHNVIELKRKTYFYVGKVLSMSLIHGGPAPSFFSEPVADYILYGLEKVAVNISDVYDYSMKQKLQKVNNDRYSVVIILFLFCISVE